MLDSFPGSITKFIQCNQKREMGATALIIRQHPDAIPKQTNTKKLTLLLMIIPAYCFLKTGNCHF